MEELELIQRSLDGELEAWGEIVKRYKQAVFGIALGILGNPADAEDATQDAFIRAYENLHRYDLKRKFSTWIFTIVSNICKNQLRRQRFGSIEDEARIAATNGDPAREVLRDEHSKLVREALNRLRFDYRAPLILRYYAGLDYKEIARVLRIPEGTVKTRIHRGKAELRRILEEKGVDVHAYD